MNPTQLEQAIERHFAAGASAANDPAAMEAFLASPRRSRTWRTPIRIARSLRSNWLARQCMGQKRHPPRLPHRHPQGLPRWRPLLRRQAHLSRPPLHRRRWHSRRPRRLVHPCRRLRCPRSRLRSPQATSTPAPGSMKAPWSTPTLSSAPALRLASASISAPPPRSAECSSPSTPAPSSSKTTSSSAVTAASTKAPSFALAPFSPPAPS